ncbi:hypothetical protein C8J56DRAFT_974234 [Mycena floridula]|nr:hypothetical protein C8J56DRAFT_974234 [Mycena floridula]
MARRKEFALKFTDSLLLSGPPSALPTEESEESLADDIFNDPESWSDGSLKSGSSDEIPIISPGISVPRNVGSRATAVRRAKPQPQLMMKAFKIEPPQWGEESPVISIREPAGKELTLDLQRMSLFFNRGTMFGSFPSPVTPESCESSGKQPYTPLTVTTAVTLRSPGVGSPIVVSASATWSFLEWYGAAPETPKLPRTAGYLQSAPSKADWLNLPPVPRLMAPSPPSPKRSPFLTVPKVPPTPTKYTPRRNRPLPTVPAPLPSAASSCTSPPTSTVSPPPRTPPRGARLRSPPPKSATALKRARKSSLSRSIASRAN